MAVEGREEGVHRQISRVFAGAHQGDVAGQEPQCFFAIVVLVVRVSVSNPLYLRYVEVADETQDGVLGVTGHGQRAVLRQCAACLWLLG